MEKKKNDTLPDEVLFINKGNLSYLQGDIKELANKKEVFKNIAWQAGSSSEPDLQMRLISSGIFLIAASFFLCLGSFTLFAAISQISTEPLRKIAMLIALALPFCGLGIWGAYYAVRQAIYRPEKIHKLYSEIIQHGRSCGGDVTRTNYIHCRVEYRFTTPTGKRISGSYHTNIEKLKFIRTGQSVVVLYLNDKTHILL